MQHTRQARWAQSDTDNVRLVAKSCIVQLVSRATRVQRVCGLFATRCVDASVRLLRGVLAQHRACGELALVGVLFEAPLTVAMRAAVRAAVRAAERKLPRARARRTGPREARSVMATRFASS